MKLFIDKDDDQWNLRTQSCDISLNNSKIVCDASISQNKDMFSINYLNFDNIFNDDRIKISVSRIKQITSASWLINLGSLNDYSNALKGNILSLANIKINQTSGINNIKVYFAIQKLFYKEYSLGSMLVDLKDSDIMTRYETKNITAQINAIRNNNAIDINNILVKIGNKKWCA